MSSVNLTLEFGGLGGGGGGGLGSEDPTIYRKPHILGSKNNWGMQSKNGLQNLWGNIVFFILC